LTIFRCNWYSFAINAGIVHGNFKCGKANWWIVGLSDSSLTGENRHALIAFGHLVWCIVSRKWDHSSKSAFSGAGKTNTLRFCSRLS
jgi:hypothetical protein